VYPLAAGVGSDYARLWHPSPAAAMWIIRAVLGKLAVPHGPVEGRQSAARHLFASDTFALLTNIIEVGAGHDVVLAMRTIAELARGLPRTAGADKPWVSIFFVFCLVCFLTFFFFPLVLVFVFELFNFPPPTAAGSMPQAFFGWTAPSSLCLRRQKPSL
jgi:hypothetical protein